MSEAKKISELETGSITENSYFLNTTIDDVNGNSSTKVGIDALKNAVNPLPAVTSSDNNRYLRVVSGKWQKVTNQTSASFTENYGALMPTGQLAEEINFALINGAAFVTVVYKKQGSSDKLFFLIGRTLTNEYHFISTDFMTSATCSPNTQFTIV